MCVWYLCVREASEYLIKVVSNWLTLIVDLCETILIGGPLRTQFDDVVVLVVIFIALFSHSIGFQIFDNLR